MLRNFPVEHNTADPSIPQQPTRRRRPDLSTFFSTLSQISPDEHRSRPHAVPVPRDVSAAFYSLAEALEVMRRESEGGAAATAGEGEDGDDLLSQMIQTLLREADTPPKEVEGVSEEFCDGRFLRCHEGGLEVWTRTD